MNWGFSEFNNSLNEFNDSLNEFNNSLNEFNNSLNEFNNSLKMSCLCSVLLLGTLDCGRIFGIFLEGVNTEVHVLGCRLPVVNPELLEVCGKAVLLQMLLHPWYPVCVENFLAGCEIWGATAATLPNYNVVHLVEESLEARLRRFPFSTRRGWRRRVAASWLMEGVGW